MRIKTPVLYVLIFVIAALAPIQSLYAQQDDPFLDIKEVTSPGGIKAWLVEDHTVPVLAMEFVFRGKGSKNDPAEKQGLVRMASNTMDEGAGDIESQAFQKERACNAMAC